MKMKVHPIKKPENKERLRRCNKCKKDGLDRRRASEHSKVCWKNLRSEPGWTWADDKGEKYIYNKNTCPGNNHNRRMGTTACNKEGVERYQSEFRFAWNKIKKFKKGRLDAYKWSDVMKGLKYLFMNVGADMNTSHVGWKMLKKDLFAAYGMGQAYKKDFIEAVNDGIRPNYNDYGVDMDSQDIAGRSGQVSENEFYEPDSSEESESD